MLMPESPARAALSTFDTLPAQNTLFKFAISAKAFASTALMLAGISISAAAVPSKAAWPIVRTPSASAMFSRAVQPAKARAGMSATLPGMLTARRAEQFSKADEPMTLTVAGIVISSSAVWSLNAPSARAATV